MDDKAFCTWWTGGSASDADNSRESLQEQSVQGSTQGQSANEGKRVHRIGKDSGKSVTSISPQYRGGRLLEPAFSLSYNFRPSRHLVNLSFPEALVFRTG